MESENETNKGPLFGVRHTQVLLLLFNKTVIYFSRTYVSVAVVAMTNAASSNPDFKEYQWNEKEKSYIFSSLFWGFVIGQIPSSYFLRRYGCKINLFFFTFGSGIMDTLIPLCIDWGGWQIFCLFRFLQGLLQASTIPANYQHIALWIPPAEINRFGGLMFFGLDFGSALAILLTGVISESQFGWPCAFYLASFLCFFWCILWLIFGANNIMTSKFITESERSYIEQRFEGSIDFKQLKLAIPWRSILTSIPFWSLVIVRSAFCCSFFTVQSMLPSYMNAIFQLDIKANAIYSSLPYLLAIPMLCVFMALADFIRKRNIFSLTVTRKIFNSISMCIPATGIIIISFLDKKHQLWVIIIITIAIGVSSATVAGSSMTCVELAPNYTDIIATIVCLTYDFTTLMGPLLAGIIINDKTNRQEWEIAFLMFAVIYYFGDLIFLLWGSSNIQPWNDPNFSKKQNEEINFQTKIAKNYDNHSSRQIIEQTHL